MRQYGILLCDNSNFWDVNQSGGYIGFGYSNGYIRAKHPRTQGKMEHFNRSYKDECLKQRMPENYADAKIKRQQYRDFY